MTQKAHKYQQYLVAGPLARLIILFHGPPALGHGPLTEDGTKNTLSRKGWTELFSLFMAFVYFQLL